MVSDRRLVTSGATPDTEPEERFELPEMPDPEEVSAALVRITDGAAEALDNLTEERASDGIEAALGALADMLDRLGQQLPSSPEGCEAVAEVLSAHTAQSASSSGPSAPALTREEVRAGIDAVVAMLADLRVALLGVSRSEVEEMVEAGLPLARLAVSAARASALRLQKAALELKQKSTVVIEDLDDPRSCLQSSGTDCSINVLPKRRYFWQPLWPWLRHEAWPRLRQLTTKPEACLPTVALNRPLLTLVLALLVAPPMLCCGFFVGPWVILADLVLQRAYAWKGQVVEDVLETAARALRFWLLALRLFIRQLRRFLRHQTSRFLRDCSFSDLRSGLLRCLQAFGRDPLGSLKAVVAYVVSTTRWIFKKLPQWYACLPRLSDLMSPLAFTSFARA